MPDEDPVFNFMYLRQPAAVGVAESNRDYIRDLDEPAGETSPALLAAPTASLSTAVAALVFAKPEPSAGLAQLKTLLLARLTTPTSRMDLERFTHLTDADTFYVIPD